LAAGSARSRSGAPRRPGPCARARSAHPARGRSGAARRLDDRRPRGPGGAHPQRHRPRAARPDAGAGRVVTAAGLSDRLARVAWSRLVEPGDTVAGWLIAAVGAGPAFLWARRACGEVLDGAAPVSAMGMLA